MRVLHVGAEMFPLLKTGGWLMRPVLSRRRK